MKNIFLLMLSFIAFLQSCTNQKSELSQAKTKELMGKTIYDFKVESLDGKEINFADFKGKKILIVNTASECGFTPQYADLEKVYEQYKDKLVIVGFPANKFWRSGTGNQYGNRCFLPEKLWSNFSIGSKSFCKRR